MPDPALHWTEVVLANLDIALLVAAGVWLVAEGLRAAHRRAYNLTKAETTQPASKLQPSFTKVDHEARAAALARGDAYAEARAASAAEAEGVAPKLPPWGKLARMTSRVVAAAIVALVPPTASGIAAREGVNFSITDVAQRYPLGIGLAIVVLVISLVQVVRSRA